MTEFLEQASHNERFHKSICESYPDDYFDWKITCLFYGAIHVMRCLAHKWGYQWVDNHTGNIAAMHPKKKREFPVKHEIYNAFHTLYQYSMAVRYNGIPGDPELHRESLKADHADAVRRFNYIKKYVQGLGIPLQ